MWLCLPSDDGSVRESLRVGVLAVTNDSELALDAVLPFEFKQASFTYSLPLPRPPLLEVRVHPASELNDTRASAAFSSARVVKPIGSAMTCLKRVRLLQNTLCLVSSHSSLPASVIHSNCLNRLSHWRGSFESRTSTMGLSLSCVHDSLSQFFITLPRVFFSLLLGEAKDKDYCASQVSAVICLISE